MKLRIDANKRPQPPLVELHSDSKTVRYDLWMLLGLPLRFSSADNRGDTIAANACVESFGVHCRALIFFLYGHLDEITANGKTERFATPRDNDVLAYDFHPAWPTHCPNPSELLVQSKWQADKHVAHITVDRREVNQPGSTIESIWPLPAVASDISNVFATFLANAPAGNFDPNELQTMHGLITNWKSVIATQPAAPVPTPGNLSRVASLQATTDARTLSPDTHFKLQGKTE